MRTDGRLGSLAEAISVLAKQMSKQPREQGGDPAVFNRIAQGQDRMVEGQEQLIAALNNQNGDSENVDAETRMRLRNIDVQLLRVLEEMSAGRQDSTAEIRQDLATLNYTLQQAIAQGEE